jgi:hypothetical protein
VRYVRYRINPHLAGILGDLHGSPLGLALADRLEQLATLSDPAPAGEDLSTALAPHLWVLERAADGGIPLTSAGYVKPADVKALAPLLPTMHDWIFPVTREVDVHPVLAFREHLVRVGLLRKAKGALVPTAAGKGGLANPEKLWQHLASRLLPTRSAFDGTATTLILLHAATSDGGRLNLPVIAQALGDLGWAHPGGAPILAHDVHWVWNDVWAALGNVGPRADSGRRDRRKLSAAAVTLIRDALLTLRTP